MRKTETSARAKVAQFLATSQGGRGKSNVDSVTDLDGRFLECRDIGHQWKTVQTNVDVEWKRLFRKVRCVRCRTERLDRLRFDGSIMNRSYVYVDDYLLKGMTDRKVGLKLQEVRAEMIRRTLHEST